VLNPISEKDTMNELSICGINIMMNKSNSSTYDDIVIFFIGEIYNLSTWITQLQLPLESKAEDVIIHLYKKYGIEYTLQSIDGVFSFILFDYYYENIISNVYIVKDPFGIVPFYCFTNNKTILFTGSKAVPDTFVEHLLYPGSYTIYDLGYKVNAEWVVSPIKNRSYFVVPNSIISSPVDNYSVSLYNVYKCMKKTILKMNSSISDRIADFVVEKLFSQIDYQKDNQYDVEIFDNIKNKMITFSSLNFFVDPDSFENMFDYDYRMRNKLQLTIFETDKIYPFYDKSFVQSYFSIPLQIRYNFNKQLFSYEKI
jgi:hypothetical protein